MEIPTPEELNQQQEAADEGAFNQAINALTETLRRQYVANARPVDTTIAASLVNERVQRRIISTFAKKGWTVAFGRMMSDQRDGNYYDVRIQANANPRN